jgi:hypothetical protein
MKPVDEIAVELVFPVAYGVSLLAELPARGGTDHVFARDGRVVDGGVLVDVVTATCEWTGLVANAPDSVSAAHSGVYATPGVSTLCVVARGDAYFLDVDAPQRWWVLEDSPVIAVRWAVAEGLLVFATPWRLVAVDEKGVKWQTSRIAINGMSLGEPAGGELPGVADPVDDESQDFVVELRTGHHRGGFPFPG